MAFFQNQFSNVVEWEEYREDVIFWKWDNREIKKGSRLMIRPGQDAIFLYNGKVEGVFEDEGSFDIESDILPFLSTLKGFKFGFNSGIRAEVLFVNTKEFTVKWGTKHPIAIPALGLPGGMPIRAFGTFQFKVSDRDCLIDKVAGVKKQYLVEEVKERVLGVLDQLLMKWISREGKDMFNLQANAFEIARGIQEDLDMQMAKIGLSITGFAVSGFSYPEEVQRMQEKAASQSMVGDLGRYQQMAMADAMANGGSASGLGADMVQMQMGMRIGQQMMANMSGGENLQMQNRQMQNVPVQGQPLQGGQMQGQYSNGSSVGSGPKFCPNCGTPASGTKFCPECGNRLVM